MTSAGTLFIVSTPIGDPRDITLRALEVLRTCDLVVCEEAKPAKALLHRHDIDKPIALLNEHTVGAVEAELIDELLAGKNLALISDCGTPLLADPGETIVSRCVERGIPVVPVPGASSVLGALVVSGFSLKQFLFAGFLPRDKDLRKKAVADLRSRTETFVLLEAPYRLAQLLDDLTAGLGESRRAMVACDLTLEGERVRRGTLGELRHHFAEHPFKGEFVVIVEGAKAASRDRNVTPRRRPARK